MKNNWLISGIMVVMFLISSFAVLAQPEIEEVDEAMGTDEYAQKGPKTSRIITGGTLGLGFGSFAASVEISPQLGYRITDHFHAGLNMTYIFQSQKNNGGGSTSFSAFGGGPFLRYLLFNFEGFKNNYGKETGLPMSGIYAATEFQRVKGRTNQTFNTGERVKLSGENALFFGAGYTSNYYRGFGYYFEILYNVIWEENFIQNENGPNFPPVQQSSFWPWPVVPRAGFYYAF